MLTTNQKGVIAETKIAATAVELGVGVWLPLSGHEPYDLIFDVAGRLLRIQCKWAVRRGGIVAVTYRRNRRGPTGFIQRVYDAGEIDMIAAYCGETNHTYLLPEELSVGRNAIQLRLEPTRNNQAAGVHWARDYEFGATLTRLLGP